MPSAKLRKAGEDTPATRDPGAFTPQEEGLASIITGDPAEQPRAIVPAALTSLVDSHGFNRSELKRPQLKVVNGQGPLSQKFNQGDLLFADEVLFEAPRAGEPRRLLTFIPVDIRQQWRMNLTKEEADAGTNQIIVDTIQDALNIDPSATFKYIDGEKPRFSECAKTILLVQQPEGADHIAQFALPGDDGEVWAPAVTYSSGGAFKKFAHAIYSVAQTACLEDDRRTVNLAQKYWTAEVVRTVTKPGFVVFYLMPKLTNKRVTGAALDYVNLVRGSAAKDEPMDE